MNPGGRFQNFRSLDMNEPSMLSKNSRNWQFSGITSIQNGCSRRSARSRMKLVFWGLPVHLSSSSLGWWAWVHRSAACERKSDRLLAS